jgi:hypothetical protein
MSRIPAAIPETTPAPVLPMLRAAAPGRDTPLNLQGQMAHAPVVRTEVRGWLVAFADRDGSPASRRQPQANNRSVRGTELARSRPTQAPTVGTTRRQARLTLR